MGNGRGTDMITEIKIVVVVTNMITEETTMAMGKTTNTTVGNIEKRDKV